VDDVARAITAYNLDPRVGRVPEVGFDGWDAVNM
jgi:hypothetical protein